MTVKNCLLAICVYKQYVDDLTIRHLASDSYTMQRESLPCGLRRLRLGQEFDQHFDHLVIPSSVETIELGEDFNRSLESLLVFGY